MNGFDYDKLDQEVDDLLSDVKSFLKEQDDPSQEEAGSSSDVTSQTPSAEQIQIDYEKFYGEVPPEPNGQEQAPADVQMTDETIVFQPLTAYEQSKPAYQNARRAQYERERERERLAREHERIMREQEEERIIREMERKQKKSRRAGRQSDEAYSQWLYEQGNDDETIARREQMAAEGALPNRRGRQRRSGGAFWKVLLVLLVLLAGAVGAVHFIWADQPIGAQSFGTRKEGYSTILIAGTDASGYRTDTMMLMRIAREEGAISLVSIPRDTLVYCEYSVPKINSAYGWANGGEAGMDQLMHRVSEIIGFMPDGYIVMQLDVFEQLVDLMGGVEFDVPVDMYYSDPTQDLLIDLEAGVQTLDAEQAMHVVRFRSGYADADLGRVVTQRSFVSSALDQWVSVKNLPKLPAVMKIVQEKTNTSLSSANLMWLAEALLVCDLQNVQTRTLPGKATMIAGGSYYVLDSAGVAETVNTCLNPYEQGVAVSDLFIRVG